MKSMNDEWLIPTHTLICAFREFLTADEVLVEVKVTNGILPSAITTPEEQKEEQCKILPEQVTYLEGHKAEVFTCSWNPVEPLMLATGSGDGTARIWHVPFLYRNTSSVPDPIVLQGGSKNPTDTQEPKAAITSIDWNPTGQYLATGSYDGTINIWSSTGKLCHSLNKHSGPIFSLKFNGSGNYLLSGSADGSAIVWNAKTGDPIHIYAIHNGTILDVDWLDDSIFSSCSSDKTIAVCEVGKEKPLKVFVGHENDVNAIKWDPSGTFLASACDDKTAKLWKLADNQAYRTFREHEKEIYTLEWNPVPHHGVHLLATASFDATVRLWDPSTGLCLHKLARHTEPIYSVSFSSDGKYLASGSFDQYLMIWSLNDDGRLLKSYYGSGGIFQVSWQKQDIRNTGKENGNHSDANKERNERLAVCFSNHKATVIEPKLQ